MVINSEPIQIYADPVPSHSVTVWMVIDSEPIQINADPVPSHKY